MRMIPIIRLPDYAPTPESVTSFLDAVESLGMVASICDEVAAIPEIAKAIEEWIMLNPKGRGAVQ